MNRSIKHALRAVKASELPKAFIVINYNILKIAHDRDPMRLVDNAENRALSIHLLRQLVELSVCLTPHWKAAKNRTVERRLNAYSMAVKQAIRTIDKLTYGDKPLLKRNLSLVVSRAARIYARRHRFRAASSTSCLSEHSHVCMPVVSLWNIR